MPEARRPGVQYYIKQNANNFHKFDAGAEVYADVPQWGKILVGFVIQKTVSDPPGVIASRLESLNPAIVNYLGIGSAFSVDGSEYKIIN